VRVDAPRAEPPRVEPPRTEPPKPQPAPHTESAASPGEVVPADNRKPNAVDGGNPPSPEPARNDEPGIFSPPATFAPVIIGAGIGIGGLVATIVFASSKSTAQGLVTTGDAQIRKAALEGNREPTGICSAPPNANYAASCKTLQSNIDTVNSNATAANISAVVMAVGFVGAAGWYLFAPKKHENASPAAASLRQGPTARIVPMPTLDGGNLSVVGTF
jgi:hypothetical protein